MPSKKSKWDDDLDEFGRFGEPAVLILISLADGPKHGYAMTEDIAVVSGVRFGPGTLYGAITRLEGRGLIERLDSEDPTQPVPADGDRGARPESAVGEPRGGRAHRTAPAGGRMSPRWI